MNPNKSTSSLVRNIGIWGLNAFRKPSERMITELNENKIAKPIKYFLPKFHFSTTIATRITIATHTPSASLL